MAVAAPTSPSPAPNGANKADNGAQAGGDNTTNVSVPDATVQLLGKQNADDGSTNNDSSLNQDGQVAANNLTTSPVQNRDIENSTNAMDSAVQQTGNADQNGGTGNVAQEGTTNVNVADPEVALAGKQAATGTGTNNDDSASALLAKQVASGTGTNNDSSHLSVGQHHHG